MHCSRFGEKSVLLAMLTIDVGPQHRARLACVDRAFRRACAAHATTCLRRRTELVVPFIAWERYVAGAERCLAKHAAALRPVHVHFKVLRREAAVGAVLIRCSKLL